MEPAVVEMKQFPNSFLNLLVAGEYESERLRQFATAITTFLGYRAIL